MCSFNLYDMMIARLELEFCFILICSCLPSCILHCKQSGYLFFADSSPGSAGQLSPESDNSSKRREAGRLRPYRFVMKYTGIQLTICLIVTLIFGTSIGPSMEYDQHACIPISLKCNFSGQPSCI